MIHRNRRPLRARRLRHWVSTTGIALAVALTFYAFQPEDEETVGEEEEMTESYEESVAMLHLDRSFRVDAGLEPSLAGDTLWARYLRWSWRHGFSNTSVEESTVLLIHELEERVELSPRGLAGCAVAASMIGEEVMAREFSLQLSADESEDAEAYEDWISSWLDGEKADENSRAALHDWARSLLEYEMNPHWWESRVVLDLAGPDDNSEEIRQLRERESSLIHEWAWRHAWSQAISLLVLVACLLGLILFARYKPTLRRLPGLSPVVRRWGVWQMLGWFGWLTAAGYGFSGLLDGLTIGWGAHEGAQIVWWEILFLIRDPDWQLVFWQVFQLAGGLWIWRLAGSPGLRLLGLLPMGEARPSRWIVPVLAFYGLTAIYFLSMGYLRGDQGILDSCIDTTEPAQLGAIRWPWRAIFFSTLTGVVLAPVMEEIIHRGVIFQGLRARMGRWPAILLSSAVFAILHFYSWWGILDVFVAGVFFAWIYDRTRSLWPGIFLHAIGNGMITIDQWLLWGPL
ncbi:MAG: lysostaphin resistance A-like protein [Verrucomicrobiales bacterium]